MALDEQDLNRAQEHLTRSLVGFMEAEEGLGAASCLRELAGTALAGGDAPRAAHLLGAARAFLDATGFALAPDQRIRHERYVAGTRAALGEAAYDREVGRGSGWSLPVASAYALEGDEQVHSG